MDTLDDKPLMPAPMDLEDQPSIRDREFSSSSAKRFTIRLQYLTIDDAFAAKHMPDPGHEVEDFKVFTWRLSNWRKLEKKLTSPEFECGGHRW